MSLLTALVTPNNASAITLDEAVCVYALQCPSAQQLRLSYVNSELEYENYKKGFLPSMVMSLSPVNFNRSLRLLQNYETGEHNYVTEYSYTGFVNILISQKIGIMGGTIQAGSNLSFLREFRANRNNYNTSPLFLSYSQPLRGGHKSYLLTHNIRYLAHNISRKSFCQSLSTVQQEILSLYLSAYTAKLRMDIAEHDIHTGDTLLYFAKLKLDNGYITQYEYNKIELQQLNARMAAQQARHNMENLLADLTVKLGIKQAERNMTVDAPDATQLPAMLDYNIIMELVRQNNPQRLNIELQCKQAEFDRYNNRMQTRMNGNISLSYGLNQYASTLIDAYRHLDGRQSVSVTFTVPLFDWGVSSNKRKIADNNYKSTVIQANEKITEFENTIRKQTLTYNMAQENFIIAKRSLQLAREQYRLAAIRFEKGKISVYELIQAFDAQQHALGSYVEGMSSVFSQYYAVRHLTLYDFIRRKPLMDIFANI